jgi:hypothetical protein
MSSDVARFVTAQAFSSNCTICEGAEDHDITSVALLHHPTPLNLIGVGRHQQFWGNSPNASLSQELHISNSPSKTTKQHKVSVATVATTSVAVDNASPPVRLLAGIFSTERKKSLALRNRVSSLFKLWKDERICTFSAFKKLSTDQRKRSRCQFMYTL